MSDFFSAELNIRLNTATADSDAKNFIKKLQSQELKITPVIDFGNVEAEFNKLSKKMGKATIPMPKITGSMSGGGIDLVGTAKATNELNKQLALQKQIFDLRAKIISTDSAKNPNLKAEYEKEMVLAKLRHEQLDVSTRQTASAIDRKKHAEQLVNVLIKAEEIEGRATAKVADKTRLTKIREEEKAYRDQLKALSDIQKLESSKKTKISNIDSFMAVNTKLNGTSIEAMTLNKEFLNLRSAIESCGDVKGLSALSSQMAHLKNETKAAGLIGRSFGDELKNDIGKLFNWLSASTVIFQSVGLVKSAFGEVVQIDSAMTNLYKVTEETDARYNKFLQTSAKNAIELGKTVSGLVDQSAEWAKLGFTIDEAEYLSKSSSIYANVGEVADVTAVQDLVTTLKGFNIEAMDTMNIVDQLNILGNNYAVSSGNLGEGLRTSASSMALAGNDLAQTLAMITGMSEIEWLSPCTVMYKLCA